MGRWFDCVELFLIIDHGSFIVGMTMRYIHLAIIVLDQTRHYQMICVELNAYMICMICKKGNFQVSKISFQTIKRHIHRYIYSALILLEYYYRL